MGLRLDPQRGTVATSVALRNSPPTRRLVYEKARFDAYPRPKGATLGRKRFWRCTIDFIEDANCVDAEICGR